MQTQKNNTKYTCKRTLKEYTESFQIQPCVKNILHFSILGFYVLDQRKTSGSEAVIKFSATKYLKRIHTFFLSDTPE